MNFKTAWSTGGFVSFLFFLFSVRCNVEYTPGQDGLPRYISASKQTTCMNVFPRTNSTSCRATTPKQRSKAPKHQSARTKERETQPTAPEKTIVIISATVVVVGVLHPLIFCTCPNPLRTTRSDSSKACKSDARRSRRTGPARLDSQLDRPGCQMFVHVRVSSSHGANMEMRVQIGRVDPHRTCQPLYTSANDVSCKKRTSNVKR